MKYEDIIAFHGHSCPGLAIGYRMARAALHALQTVRSQDEEVVAIVENDACGVDALQCVAGCTFGKGNLIFRDYGKHVYTLYARSSGEGVRVVFHGKGIRAELRDDRPAMIKTILEMPESEIVSVQRLKIEAPQEARIHQSVACSSCGESVMNTKVRHVGGKNLCIPCAERTQQP